MRSQFDKQLAQLHRELIEMGALCEQAIAMAAQALTESDAALAGQVSGLERDIDRKERDIENLCLRLLLHQQPVAGDLRQISAALKMITDMERIGDQADDIAELIPHLPAGGRLFRPGEALPDRLHRPWRRRRGGRTGYSHGSQVFRAYRRPRHQYRRVGRIFRHRRTQRGDNIREETI